MLYFVPDDLDVTDLDEIDEAWELVSMVTDWMPVVHKEEHQTDSGGTHTHELVQTYPILLDCNKDGSAAIPGRPYFGEGRVFTSRIAATSYAKSVFKGLHKQRRELGDAINEILAGGSASDSTS
jgi:hypothetical protein